MHFIMWVCKTYCILFGSYTDRLSFTLKFTVHGYIMNTLEKKSALICRVKQFKNSFCELLDPVEKGIMIF